MGKIKWVIFFGFLVLFLSLWGIHFLPHHIVNGDENNPENTVPEDSDARNYPRDQGGLGMLLSPGWEQEGIRPQKERLYSLAQMLIIAKRSNGYFIGGMSPDGGIDGGVDIAFLNTNKEFDQGQLLGGGMGGNDSLLAYYVGTYTYTTNTGFNKTIYAFKLYEG